MACTILYTLVTRKHHSYMQCTSKARLTKNVTTQMMSEYKLLFFSRSIDSRGLMKVQTESLNFLKFIVRVHLHNCVSNNATDISAMFVNMHIITDQN